MSTPHDDVVALRGADLFRAVADQIEQHPEQYDQGTWGSLIPECGTVCCIAGWAARLALPGWQAPVYPGDQHVDASERRELVSSVPIDLARAAGVTGWGLARSVPVSDVARQLLGLEQGDADELFSQYWLPAGFDDAPLEDEHRLVAAALRRLADGESVADVTQE